MVAELEAVAPAPVAAVVLPQAQPVMPPPPMTLVEENAEDDDEEDEEALAAAEAERTARLSAYSAVQQHEALVAWVKDKLRLLSTEVDELWDEGIHRPPVSAFVSSPTQTNNASITPGSELSGGNHLFAHITTTDCKRTLHVSTSVPFSSSLWTSLMYMVRDPVRELTAESATHNISMGVVENGGDNNNNNNTNVADAVLRLMERVFIPAVLRNRTWPDTLRREFTGHLHKFMAGLTEAVWHAKGKTVLYIPKEEDLTLAASTLTNKHNNNIATSPNNNNNNNNNNMVTSSNTNNSVEKDLVQRLESTLIHWTRQIKEVVNNQDNSAELGEDAGPLAEIGFWRSRSVDLSGIRAQLDDPGVASIVAILDHAKSSYLGPFLSLSNLIQREAIAAEDNLRFLSLLEGPCKALSQAAPKDIPNILPRLLNCIRIIWNVSRFYNTPERLTGLLRKVSNEIINRCRATVSLTEVFDGDAVKCVGALRESIRAGESWKRAYAAAADAVSIFAHMEAFVQRCRDLLEVSEARGQFAPNTTTNTTTTTTTTSTPVFGGARGPEIAKSLQDIYAAFQKLVGVLRSLSYSILDVKATRWHDDYNAFKSGVKDLEVMFQNVVTLAFETASALPARVDLAEAFWAMARRDAVRRCVEKKTGEVYAAFLAELNAVKRHFDQMRRHPPIHPSFPRHAGAALWAQSLLKRVEGPLSVLRASARERRLPLCSSEAQEVDAQHSQLSTAVDQYVRNQHADWSLGVESALVNPQGMRRLEGPLLVQEEEGQGLLSVNFERSIVALFHEAALWESRLGLEVPFAAMEAASQRERLRVLREHVLLVARDYNRILGLLDDEERRLFADRIRHLDRRVAPGLSSKLTWVSGRHHLDHFNREARRHCAEAEALVLDFKSAGERIASRCRAVAEGLLISVEKKRVYEEGEFEARQKEHREAARARLEGVVVDIKETLATAYAAAFAADGPEVQAEWANYTRKVDRKLEDALRAATKKSLQELSRALNGDAKTEVAPVFNVIVALEPRHNVVELRPSVQDLFLLVQAVAKDLLTVLTAVPRLAITTNNKLLSADLSATDGENTTLSSTQTQQQQQQLPSFYELISGDEDATLKAIAAITGGVTAMSDKVQQFLSYWEKKYKHIWDQDKEAYIRRYEKAKKPLSAFEADIGKYRELAEEVLAEDTATAMRFLRIDCGPLKQTLVSHCHAWLAKFTKLLNNLAASELRAIHQYFESNSTALRQPPLNLDMLGESVNLLRRVTDELPATEARFVPVQDKYRALERFEVEVPEEETALLARLPQEWAAFRATLAGCERDLERAKDGFRDKLNKMVDGFARQVSEQREDFLAKAPYVAEIGVEAAMLVLAEARAAGDAARKRESELKAGLDIFRDASQPVMLGIGKDLGATEKELELLDSVWGVRKEWLASYDGWKDGLFRDLRVEEMDDAAQRLGKRLAKLGRNEIKAWSVWQETRDAIDAFKKTMPLIADLRSPALRPRHWEQLMDAVGKRFDPTGQDFTLDKVSDLHLENHAERIAELAASAAKELAIEQALEGIETTWKGLNLDLVPHSKTGAGANATNAANMVYKLRGAEDVFAALEENTVALSTMKASRFFTTFEKEITQWEQALSLVSETIEMVLQVQRQWAYLENIFVGSEDIRKQLPQESAVFDGVNEAFARNMRALQKESNALRGARLPGLLDAFTDMDAKLERVQKSLEDYLEQKRQQFPRFYFLSSDDLLEILGQAKDPVNVQPHLKKCFEGIKRLDMNKPAKVYESAGAHSPDGEYLSFMGSNVVPTPNITGPGVALEGRPEEWLNRIEAAMFASTRRYLIKAIDETGVGATGSQTKPTKRAPPEKWLRDNAGQCVITAGQVAWTAECEKALADAENAKTALRQLKKKWISYLNKLTAVTRSKLSKVDRLKTVALITIEVHARDVIERLGKCGCSAPTDFEWQSQLRFYWDKDKDSSAAGYDNDNNNAKDKDKDNAKGDCVIRQVLSVFAYGYEYQGNNGRLVVTPLTDRCYMTLGAAMFTRRGGNPLGPAGTGKTETVKDFGKALARYVIVFNCSDGVDYKMTGKMFAGLAQTGAWACLDEFNRIEVEVLSVVATQISTVMLAIKAGVTRFVFEGAEIRLIASCGIFVTMNPGYAGRSELPDNLKAMLRPVSMMVPDFTLIAEIMMFSEGFQTAKLLSRKMIAIMELSQQQLSKQDHYDYGLRSFVIPIARAAGASKRIDPDAPEEVIMHRTMRDLIVPKLVYADLPLFAALLQDLFPGVEAPPMEGGELRAAIEEELRNVGLQPVADYVSKIIQVYDCKVARHGNMIVGKTGAGKSEAWKCLSRAMAALKKKGVEDMERVHVYTINPLALSNDELYGCFSAASREWCDGVLAKVMRTACRDEALDQKWILFDGPVDTLWIESMNTLLDDNKLLTLLSGERIAMPPQVSILFEVEDLSQASPATVSRAGMIYMNVEDLGWRPFVESWLAKKTDASIVDTLRRMIEKCVDAALEFKRKECRELVATDRQTAVRSLCHLFDAVTIDNNNNDTVPMEAEQAVAMTEMFFLFSLVWSLGGALDEESRRRFDLFIRDLDPRFPAADTVYEYVADRKRRAWVAWEERLGGGANVGVGGGKEASVVGNNTNTGGYKPPADAPFHSIVVPTIDTLRTKHVLSALVHAGRHALVMGNVGVGKTVVAQQLLTGLPENHAGMIINFSAQTSSNSLQETIEGRLEKRTKGVYAPPGGKRLVCFIDDISMPQKSKFGFMPPLELLKLWVDNGFWYDRERQEVKSIKEMQLLAALAPPGGGRSAFSARILACFFSINMTLPSDTSVRRIFGTMVGAKLSDFDDEIKPLAEPLTQASIELFNNVVAELLPTPAKSHYLFNMRDLAKVTQGVMQATRAFYDSREAMLQLWCHECFRVFGDRMWDPADKAWLRNAMDERLSATFSSSWKTLFPGEDGSIPPFVSFMREGMDNPPYEPVTDANTLKELLQERLEDFGLEPGQSAMDLVLFRDAVEHVCRVHRILSQPRGNALLVGVGGSGRKSLARLAAYVAGLKLFSVEISKAYRTAEFREDLKLLYRQAGCGDKPTAFVFDDTQIVVETFLEDVNNVLTSGEVPNLFARDELQGVLEEVRPAAKKVGVGETADALYGFFIDRVRANLHVVLCLSPIGETFRNRLRMFPGLVNCTTIDWFVEWPADALNEVAHKLIDNEESLLPAATSNNNSNNNTASSPQQPPPQQQLRDNICTLFQVAHQSVVSTSAAMLAQLRRHNYVTPTNYLEFVQGYRALLREKKQALGEAADKLRGGLQKLEETKEQVAVMQGVCQEKKVTVAKAKRDSEDLLVEIVQEKRAADEQEKQVSAEAQKIEREAAECNVIATDCQKDLDKALPALKAAEDALNVLTKKDLSEVKAYAKPPALVEMTLSAVMTVLRRPPTWDETKKALGDASFLEKLLRFDKDKLDDALLKKIGKFTANADFTPDAVGKVSNAAKGLCMWVGAMEVYGHVSKEVAPKRAKLKAATDTLSKKQAALQAARDALAEVLAKVQALKDRYEASAAAKEALQRELDDLEVKLGRAEKLVLGLAGEKTRWEASIASLEEKMGFLPGDCLIAAAFLSYAGPFPSAYRERLVKQTWLPQVKELAGLPADAFSTENGVMVTRGRRWPLMVDPQGQAVRWVRNMESNNTLKVVNLQASDLMRVIENAITAGRPVLLQDVAEEIDPALENVLAKAFIKRGNQLMIKLGDKEVDYHPSFKLYVTTKLSNPHYTPEVSTRVAIVNFAVKEQGLEAQLLNTVVQRERPDLDRQKNELVAKVAAGKRTQAKLEDDILRMLSTATGSLLDNVELIDTLDRSKTTWEEINESLKVAEETAKKIETASAAYKPCAVRASALYFVLNELAAVDPMYQFSLDAYNDLFLISIAKSTKNDTVVERIKALNEYHTYAVYRYAARGLFEAHKLLLSLQMCVRILQSAGQINAEEWQFFLRGGTVLDKSQQPPNPATNWISEEAWDNITELDRVLPAFSGLAASFSQGGTTAWEAWYRQGEAETAELPGEWESKCSELQRMMLVRCLRPDRVLVAAAAYVAGNLGRRFVEPPVLDLGETLADSLPTTPLIFVLSPGVDPTSALAQLAAQRGLLADGRFHSVALGQGQAAVATKLIEEGAREGKWVFLANCHLMTSWLPTLDKLVESLEARKPHADFRLWLSSSPSPAFPIAVLQRGIKMTTEPPKGLRANLLRLYGSVTEESFAQCKSRHKYQKLFFALTYFHSVLLERRKFRTLGLNIPYDFNDTDFQVSDDLLKTYLDEYAETPWDALKYLVAEANYGGRVTDELDRRVLASYLNQFYCEEALTIPNYPLSTLSTYYIPDDGPLQSYRDYIQTLPAMDRAEAFGQHANGDISFQISDARIVLETIVGLQPRTVTSGGGSGGKREDIVMAVATDLLAQVPEPFDIEAIVNSKKDDPSALHVVLFQELDRYNRLLSNVRSSCVNLQKGIKGLVVMSAELDLVLNALFDAKVPASWLKTYPSLKPLGPWTRDLLQRIQVLREWIEGGYPKVYWLSGFTYPTSFLTAVLQTTARRNAIPIDTLGWDFTIVNLAEHEIVQAPKEGVYVRGVYLEGAGWDPDAGALCEPEPMELIVPMPIIHFKPVENKKKTGKGVYACPLYMYPVRTGTRERPSFMISVDLKAGSADSDGWVKRGTALLLALAS
eukprot:jgi/Chlat1/5861/Chrsp4S06373